MSTHNDVLSGQHCEVCRAGAPAATTEEISRWMAQLPDWEIVESGRGRQLRRGYRFRDFVGALAFTNRVGEMAESQGHHPDLLTRWGEVYVTWWTHKINDLHRNDFICATRCDELYESASGAGQVGS